MNLHRPGTQDRSEASLKQQLQRARLQLSHARRRLQRLRAQLRATEAAIPELEAREGDLARQAAMHARARLVAPPVPCQR